MQLFMWMRLWSYLGAQGIGSCGQPHTHQHSTDVDKLKKLVFLQWTNATFSGYLGSRFLSTNNGVKAYTTSTQRLQCHCVHRKWLNVLWKPGLWWTVQGVREIETMASSRWVDISWSQVCHVPTCSTQLQRPASDVPHIEQRYHEQQLLEKRRQNLQMEPKWILLSHEAALIYETEEIHTMTTLILCSYE